MVNENYLTTLGHLLVKFFVQSYLLNCQETGEINHKYYGLTRFSLTTKTFESTKICQCNYYIKKKQKSFDILLYQIVIGTNSLVK